MVKADSKNPKWTLGWAVCCLIVFVIVTPPSVASATNNIDSRANLASAVLPSACHWVTEADVTAAAGIPAGKPQIRRNGCFYIAINNNNPVDQIAVTVGGVALSPNKVEQLRRFLANPKKPYSVVPNLGDGAIEESGVNKGTAVETLFGLAGHEEFALDVYGPNTHVPQVSTITMQLAQLAVVRMGGQPSPPVGPGTTAAAEAVHATVATKASKFTLAVSVSAGIQGLLGSGATLHGSGSVNYQTRSAQWSISGIHGTDTLRVIAIRGTTYVTGLGAPDPSGKTRWIALQSFKDYAAFDAVPVVRDLVVLTNPLRALELAASVPGTASSPSTGASNEPNALGGHRAPIRLADASVSADCPKDPKAKTVADGAAAQQLADTFGVNQKTTLTSISSWATNQVKADSGPNDSLCSESVSVSDVNGEGFDVVYHWSVSTPATIAAPNVQETVDYTETLHVRQGACYMGVWTAQISQDSGVTVLEGATPWTVKGSMDLTLTPLWEDTTTKEVGASVIWDKTESLTSTITEPNPFYIVGAGTDLGPTGSPTITSALSANLLSSAEGNMTGPIADSGVFNVTMTGIVQGSIDNSDRSQPIVLDRGVSLDWTLAYTCSSLTLSSSNWGSVTFTKTSSTPPPTIVSPELQTSTKWRVGLKNFQGTTGNTGSTGSSGNTGSTGNSGDTGG